MSIFPSNSELGKLKIVEVYDYHEGPKFFCAQNQFRQLMIVYWVDHNDSDDAYGWLYLYISEEKLNKLRRGQLSVREVYKNPEQGLYLVYTFPEHSNDTIKYHSEGEISNNLLPPADIFISPHDIEVIDDKEANWVYELHIKKSNSYDLPSTTAVTSVLNAFREIIEPLMKTSTRKQPTIYPLSAVPGSFKLKFISNDNKKAINALSQFEKIIASNNKNILTLLKESKLDPFILKTLYEILRDHNIDITITPKTFDLVEGEIKVSKNEVINKISTLEKSTFNIIESIKVPQANDINKVIRIVELRKKTGEITHDLIDGINSSRQVKYYIDAAFSLGLLTREGYLTSAGRFFLSKKTSDRRYQVLADRFESSEFGWAWMNWSKVTSMTKLDPNTASEFIQTCVPGLGADTAKRRATTLVKWLKILKSHHRDYHN